MLARQQFIHRGDQAFDGVDALLEFGGFGFGQTQFNDLLDSAASHDDGHDDVVASDAVFAFAKRRDRDAAFFVFHNCLDQLGTRGSRSVEGAAGLQYP